MDPEIQNVSPEAPAPESVAPAAPPAEAPKESFDQTLDRVAREAVEGKRSPDGRFQAKVVAPGAPDATEVPGSPMAATPEPAPPAIEAPQSLPDAVKKDWSSLPRAVQEAWSKREGEIHSKITADGERLKSLSAYEDLAKSLEPRLQQVNAPGPEYFRRLAAADQLLTTNGPEGIRQIAQMYGIDLRAVAAPGQQPDPNSALIRELHTLRTKVSTLEASGEQAKLRAAEETLASHVKNWPHFTEVEETMARLYTPGMDLNQLYQMACRAHPEVSAKLKSAEEEEARKKAAAEAKEKADRDARTAPFARRPGTVPTAPLKGKSWEETADRVAKDIRERA